MREALLVLLARLRGLRNRRKAESSFDEESAGHLEMLTDRFVRQGMKEAEARQAARRQFGGVTQLKEALRDQRSYPAIESLWRDFTLALRQFRSAPRFTLAIAFILALGLGACTTVFTVINAVLLRPLPYDDADRLMWVGEVLKRNTADEVTLTPDFLEWRRRNRVFTAMAAFNVLPRTLLAKDGALPLQTAKASAALLPVLRVQPILGRSFLPGEDLKGQDRVALISFGLWQRAFGGNVEIVGNRITLDDGTYEVVGILPRGFAFPTVREVDLITPLGKNEALELTRAEGSTTIVRNVVARLKPGVTQEQARAEMEVIQSNLAPPAFLSGAQVTIKGISLQGRFAGGMRSALWTLLSAGGCMLLLVCANIANLLLGRGEARRKEFAIRAALGASRGRIVQQLLVESCVIAMLGCTLGLAMAYLSRSLLLTLISQVLPGALVLPFDLRVAGFAITCAIATAVVFGVGPALISAGARPSNALSSDGRTATAGMRRRRWLHLLAAGQTAIAVVLLFGGALMLRSFWNLRYEGLTFTTDHGVVPSVDLSPSRFKTPAQRTNFMDAALTKLQSIPGIEAAGFGVLPPGDGYATNGFAIERRERPPQGSRPVAREYLTSPGYFRILGLPVQAGREFNSSDSGNGLAVALVDEAFARSQFSRENPIGHRIRSEAAHPWRTIVGVVADAHTAGMAKPIESAFFIPYTQSGSAGGGGDMGFLLRTGLDAGSIAPAIRKAIAEVDPRQPVARIEPFEQRLNDSVSQPRLAAVLLGIFAALGLVLAAAGLYSVMFVLVRSRFREIGIRLALGGQPRDMA